MASLNQQEVWNEVARSRAAFAMTLAAPEARALETSSSYAGAVKRWRPAADRLHCPFRLASLTRK